MAEEKPFDIIVNLEAKTVAGETVTYTEIVHIAFPEKAKDPNVTFKVTFRKAESEPHSGSMVDGDSVEVKKDGATSFTVVHATKS